MNTISIIVPCYNEQQTLPLFYKEIVSIIEKMDYINFEIIFIDDGSTDETLNILMDLGEKDNKINYISFSRNFRKEATIYAGLKNSSGDFISLMDVDLQDPPYLLIDMYNIITSDENIDCVATRRVSRKGESIIRSFLLNVFTN